MALLPFQMTQSADHLKHFMQDAPKLPPNEAAQLNILKAVTASYSLFTSLLTQYKKKASSQYPSSPFHPSIRLSAFTKARKPSIRSEKHAGAPFQHGSVVELSDGSVQQIEALRVGDFLRTASSVNAESLLQWVQVERIAAPKSLAGYQRGLVHIRFSLDSHRNSQTSKCNHSISPAIKFDHVCSKKLPFFVRSQGWSSCDPYLTQTHCGLSCRTLAVGDFCLVIVPLEIAEPSSSILRVDVAADEHAENAPMAAEQQNGMPWSANNNISLNPVSQSNPSAFSPQQSRGPRNEDDGRSVGAVPTYFTAASLAESPFKPKV